MVSWFFIIDEFNMFILILINNIIILALCHIWSIKYYPFFPSFFLLSIELIFFYVSFIFKFWLLVYVCVLKYFLLVTHILFVQDLSLPFSPYKVISMLSMYNEQFYLCLHESPWRLFSSRVLFHLSKIVNIF